MGNRVRRSMSSSESRRQEVTELTWYAAEDCSRSVQRRLEKLGRRRLRVGYGEQTVHETKRNADAFGTPTVLDDEVRQRGMTVPSHEDICKPELPACNPPWNFQQCNWRRSGVMWSHFDDAKTSRAAAFITDCKRCARCNGLILVLLL